MSTSKVVAMLRRAAGWGAVVGALYFLADLAGAYAAVGFLLDPTASAMALLMVGALLAVGTGAALGAITVPLWLWWRPRPIGRRFAVGAGVVCFIVVACGGYALRVGRRHVPAPAPAVQAPPGSPPVLWVVADTLRADTFYGTDFDYPLVPNAKAFAKGSVIFADVESSAGWTIPAMATLMTGVHNTTMDASAGFLPDWSPTITGRLRAAGYATHAVVDNVIMEPRNGFGAGFASFFQRSSFRFAFSLPSFRLLPDSMRENLRGSMPTSYYGSPGVTDVALDIIAQHGESQPLFLLVHYMDPHAPYYPHPELPAHEEDGEPVSYYHFRDVLRAELPTPPTPAQLRWLKHRYEDEVRAWDRDLGRLLAAWTERFGESGVVLVTSDHGEEFLEHGHLGHGITVNREMVHVPLLLRLPHGVIPDERARGAILTAPVAQIDVVPTLVDMLSLDPDALDGPTLQGVSWLPWLRGEAPAPARPLIASHSRHGRRTYRYREGDWVHIVSMFYDERPKVDELYFLPDDPTEQRNLVAHKPPVLAKLVRRSDKLARALLDAYDPDRPSNSAASEESLRALGYIE